IAAAIVMILAMRQWLSVAPTAQEIMEINQINEINRANQAAAAAGRAAHGRPGGKAAAAQDRQGDASDQQRRGRVLPDLRDMKAATDQHSAQVKQASDDTNR